MHSKPTFLHHFVQFVIRWIFLFFDSVFIASFVMWFLWLFFHISAPFLSHFYSSLSFVMRTLCQSHFEMSLSITEFVHIFSVSWIIFNFFINSLHNSTFLYFFFFFSTGLFRAPCKQGIMVTMHRFLYLNSFDKAYNFECSLPYSNLKQDSNWKFKNKNVEKWG